MDKFSALSDPNRRRIVELLAERGPMPAQAIYAEFSVSAPAVSQHLKALRDAGLVFVEKRTRQRIYQLNAAPLQAVDLWLEHYRNFWRAQLSDLKAYVEGEAGKESSGARAKKKPNRGKQS